MAIDGASRFVPPPVSGLRQRGAIVFLLVLLVMFTGLVVALYVTHTTTRVYGLSMTPTILPEDILLVTKGYDRPIRGDMIVLYSPQSPYDEPLVKRVIGVPGDEVTVVDGMAHVNGRPEEGSYTVYVAGGDINVNLITVPDGSVYVLGDNRPVSEDSRIFGSVPFDLIEGRVVAVIAPIHRMTFVD